MARHRFQIALVCWFLLLDSVLAAVEPTPQEALLEAKATWWFTRNDGSYNFNFTLSGTNSSKQDYPWLGEVRQGVVNKTTTAKGAVRPSNATPPPTIDQVFDRIQAAIDAKADTVRVQYNETHKFPTEVFLDYDAEGRGDEYSVSISSFVERPSYDVATAQAALTVARSKWDSQVKGAYTFWFSKYCFGCFWGEYPWRVQVSEGNSEGKRVRAVDSKGNVVTQTFDRPLSVPEVFDLIQQSIDNKYFNIGATYNKILGYPESFSSDQDPRMMDEEFAISIRAMEVFGNSSIQLALAREHWNGFNTPNYMYRLNIPNGDLNRYYPWTVRVCADFAWVTNAKGHTVHNDEMRSVPKMPFMGMPTHFDTIQAALVAKAEEVKVVYSKFYGYPRSTYIRYGKGKTDEILEISKFQSLPQSNPELCSG